MFKQDIGTITTTTANEFAIQLVFTLADHYHITL